MKIRVLFFGATAAAAATREVETVLESTASTADLVAHLVSRYPKLQSHNLLFAVNEQYVDSTTTLKDGDELAIFTPVSGG